MPGSQVPEGYIQGVGTHHLLMTPSGGHYMYGLTSRRYACYWNTFLFTYKSLFCSKMNAASVVVTCEVVGTLNHYKMVKKF